ncbi:hypothetical protein QJ522_22665, partial [Sedimentisphaerales bacterium M17dextr]|nr:hypothetical protein [Sedimentisphaerales bacterium M17dextr]
MRIEGKARAWANRLLATTRERSAAVVLGVLVLCVAFTWWTVRRADRQMRADLLRQTQLIAWAVDIGQIRTLSGTRRDLETPEYWALREQLGAIRSADPRCRFIYLMGRRPDGTVFFFLDAQDDTTESSPPSEPGDVYVDASDELRNALHAGVAFVEGPLPDDWGIWVSALVPLTDPATRDIVAVLGMDIDAGVWKWDVAAKAALPVGLMYLLLIGVAFGITITCRVEASPKPVLRRLFVPLTAIVLLLIGGGAALLWQHDRRKIDQGIAARVGAVRREYQIDLDNQAAGLSMALQPIVADAAMRQTLRKGDAGDLLTTWRPVFDVLRREHSVTHFYFFDPNRLCLLRVHKPEKHGDTINRFTVLEAERTGRTASGIELGPLGTFTLRV